MGSSVQLDHCATEGQWQGTGFSSLSLSGTLLRHSKIHVKRSGMPIKGSNKRVAVSHTIFKMIFPVQSGE
jgi:hypothetical protein